MRAEIESTEYETVKDLMDVVGPVGTAYTVLEFIYEFGKTDPIQNAIDRIQQELEAIRARLSALENRVEALERADADARNLARVRTLRENAIEFATLAVKVGNSLQDPPRALEAATEAGLRLDGLLEDQDLWLWNDFMKEPSGSPDALVPVDADFKPDLALPIYSMGLGVWVAAVMIDTGSSRDAVAERHGARLERHLTAVSVRPDWRDDGIPAETLPEQIRTRIRCQPVAMTKYADNDGMCGFTVQVDNTMERTREVVREFSAEMNATGSAVMCTIDPDVVLQDEREIEDNDPGVRLLALWEDILATIRASGRPPAEEFIGQFPDWTAAWISMYGVDAGGNLDFFDQKLPSTDGAWSGPLRAGTGWGFPALVAGGRASVLAQQADGEWLWYWHQGSEQQPPTDQWTGPKPVGRWIAGDPAQTNWLYFGTGWGIVYGIVLDDSSGSFTVGDLYWNKLEGYLSGEGTFSTAQRVGNGWNGLSPVFSGSEGIIYGVKPDGVLRWYQHTGWTTGDATWAEPRDLDTGVDWRQFERIVPGGQGVIYGVRDDGEMRCYRHFEWRTGGPRFEGPAAAGSGWGAYRPLFAVQPGYVDLGVH